MDLGYRDYIAARFLLNNKFIIQGLTLASTALEKYLKSIIVLTSKEKEKYSYHLDNIVKLKNILARNYHDVTKKFDPVFLNILEKVYKIRYYDNLKEPLFIGFYLNQFIGELDDTIHSLEQLFPNTSPYTRAVKNRDHHLHENNFILNKQNKKEFMQKPDTGFSVSIAVGSQIFTESIVEGKDISNNYEGQIATFTDFQPNWQVRPRDAELAFQDAEISHIILRKECGRISICGE